MQLYQSFINFTSQVNPLNSICMDSTTKTYPIKVPVYVSEKIERNDNSSLFATNVEDLINNAKSLINIQILQ